MAADLICPACLGNNADAPCAYPGEKRHGCLRIALSKTKSVERMLWIVKETRERNFVDVLDAEFVDSYIAEFNMAHRITFWGANKCKQLGTDLSRMAKLGYLKRKRTSLSDNWQPGFPRWVWSYQIGKNAAWLPTTTSDCRISTVMRDLPNE